MRQVEEKEFMTEWSDTRLKIEDWLGNAESEAYAFDKAHDNIIEVEEQVAEHEVNPIWSPNSKYYLNCETKIILTKIMRFPYFYKKYHFP